MNGQLDIFSMWKEPLKIKNKIRLIELFGGIGAQAKALERLGADFEHYRLCEFDPYAVTSYNAIHGTNFETSDVKQLKGEDLGIVDIDRFTYVLTYSYPCQSLSLAGKQEGMVEGSGTQSSLLWEVKRLLEETEELPQILVMENVPQVLSDKNKGEFNRWVNFLESKGYTSKWEILNSKDYKVPQNRERCFMVSWLGDYYYTFPYPQPLEKVLRDLLQPDEEIDDKYYLSEKGVDYVMRRDGKYTQVLDENSQIEQSAITAVGNANWTGNFIKCEHIADSVAMAHCASIPQGSYNYFVGDDLTVIDYYNHREIDNKVVGTITTGSATNGSGTFLVKKPKSPIRKLTQKECWRLMDFDDCDYEKARNALNEKFYNGKDKSGSQLYKQAGNSIVVAVLEAIFKEMIKE